MTTLERRDGYLARTRNTIEEQRVLMKSRDPESAAEAADLVELLTTLVANVEHKRGKPAAREETGSKMAREPLKRESDVAKRKMHEAVDKVIDEKKMESIGTEEAEKEVAADLNKAARRDTKKR